VEDLDHALVLVVGLVVGGAIALAVKSSQDRVDEESRRESGDELLESLLRDGTLPLSKENPYVSQYTGRLIPGHAEDAQAWERDRERYLTEKKKADRAVLLPLSADNPYVSSRTGRPITGFADDAVAWERDREQ
jgi:hypothetical protein